MKRGPHVKLQKVLGCPRALVIVRESHSCQTGEAGWRYWLLMWTSKQVEFRYADMGKPGHLRWWQEQNPNTENLCGENHEAFRLTGCGGCKSYGISRGIQSKKVASFWSQQGSMKGFSREATGSEMG